MRRETELTIVNEKGLHARASAKFVGAVERFEAEITVSRDNLSVSGLSLMGLLMLAASKGSVIHVAADGPDADAAVEAISELVASRFGETE